MACLTLYLVILLDSRILRIIHGYFDQRSLTYEETSQLRLTLISRRSVNRAGARYLRRGVDSNGHVANFVRKLIDAANDNSSFRN